MPDDQTPICSVLQLGSHSVEWASKVGVARADTPLRMSMTNSCVQLEVAARARLSSKHVQYSSNSTDGRQMQSD